MEKANIYKRAKKIELVLFGMEGFTNNIIGIFISMFFLIYATDVYGISAGAAGLIFAISKVFDAVTDPVAGVLIDRTHFKSGKFRPWVVIGVILMVTGIVMLFAGPAIGRKSAYLLIAYIIYSMGITVFGVAVGSLRSVITNDPKQRAVLPMFGTIFTMVGVILASVLTVPFTQARGNSLLAWRLISLSFAGMATVAALLFLRSVKGKDKNMKPSKRDSMKSYLDMLKGNKPVTLLSVAALVNAIASGSNTAMFMYFFTYVLNRVDLQPIVSAQTMPMFIIGGIVATIIARKSSKRTTYLLGCVLGIVVPLFLFIVRPFDNVPLLIGLMAINMAITPFTNQMQWIMVADCVEYTEYHKGRSVPSVINSIFTLLFKIGIAAGGGLSAAALAVTGFVPNAEQTGMVIEGILSVMFLVPVICFSISLVVIYFYPITRKTYQDIIIGLNKESSDEYSENQQGYEDGEAV